MKYAKAAEMEKAAALKKELEASPHLALENKHLKEQVTHLQERCQRYQDEQRGLRYQVDCFHEKFGYLRPREITVPDDDTVRFRLRLIAEEFFEVLEAVLDPSLHRLTLSKTKKYIAEWINWGGVCVDLPGFMRELADLDYVVEGTRITFGVKGWPIAEELHRANMTKTNETLLNKDAVAFSKRTDGKLLKPEGWTPPNIRGVLLKQGWEPDR